MRAVRLLLPLLILALSAPAASAGTPGKRATAKKKAVKRGAGAKKKGSTRSLRRKTPKSQKSRQRGQEGLRRRASEPKVYRPKNPLTIGMVGLGKMGGRMTERLLLGGHGVVAFDPNASARKQVADKGAVDAKSVDAMIKNLPSGKRVVWVMVPAGEVTEKVISELAQKLGKGDVIIDGGNANYKDTVRRSKMLAEKGIELVDVGTSGGVWGLDRGYSLMVGGKESVVRKLHPLFKSLAPGAKKGWGHVGPSGAGHRAKMIHNGIEYAMMQAIAEGLMLAESGGELGMDPAELSRIWKDGSVISSWLVDLTADGLSKNPKLKGFGTKVPDSGEGRWTVMDGVEQGIAIPVISQALMQRFNSQTAENNSANKTLQLMRNMFGGHEVVPADGE